ncbi:uncharacterized protein LOC144068025 [Stigmatopora argus]
MIMNSSRGFHTKLVMNLASVVRVKKSSSRHTNVLHMLLLFTGFASCNVTDTTQPEVTSTPTSVYYFVEIPVVLTGPAKNESEVASWLQEVFQKLHGSCVFSHIENTTTSPPWSQNTSASNSTMATTTNSNTATVATKPFENTTEATSTTIKTTALQNRTTESITTLTNNETISNASLTLQNNNTTIETVENSGTDMDLTSGKSNDSGNNTERMILTNNRSKNAVENSTNAGFNQETIIRSKSSNLLQGLEVFCLEKTEIRKTNCWALVALRLNLPPCCILQTICAASQNSSDIQAVGRRVSRLHSPSNKCSSAHLEEDICVYTQNSDHAKCEDSAFVAPSCGAGENNKCSCENYCEGTDAFYTFDISIRNPELNLSYPLFLISQLNQSCPSPTSIPCSRSDIASKYKNSSLDCGQAGANPQRCKVILQLAEEVPICNVSAAITALFQSDSNVTFDGRVTRAAVCGHSNISDYLLGSTLTWVNSTLQHAEFCKVQKNSSNPVSTQTCSSGQNLAVHLKEQCIPTASTTASPTASLNTSPSLPSSSPNVTSVSPSAESRAYALLALSANVSALNSSQVDHLVSQLEDLLSGPNISLALANLTIHIVSNLLGASAEILASSANRIIRIVDTVGLKVVFEETETLLSPALALSVKAVDTSNPQPILFSISDPSNVEVRGNLRFPRRIRNDASIPQGSILLPDTLTQNLTSEELQMASRVHFNYYQKSTVFQDRSLGTRRLNSGILGASLANLTVTGLQDEVVIRLRNLQPIPANYVVSCVFWDFALNDRSGGWNTNGCYVQNSTDNMTVCGCNHLTSFSILLDLAREPLTSRVQATVLTFITYIGCGISAIFLVLTLLTYLAFGKLRKDMPSKILIQLCVALLLLNLVFLVDAWLALFPDAVGLCISTAWFLHYFLLAVFTWMGLEAVHMYLALVKVFNSYVPCYMLWFSLVGWGLPLIVVIIVIAVDKDNYGLVSYGKYPDGATDDFCWLKNDIAFYVAVVAYFCIIFLFNFIMFVVVLVQLVKIKRQNPHNSKHRTAGKDVRSVVGLTILLGLTWGFAFFAWGPVNLAFMYLFAICNAFQGFFIFVFHCAVKDPVRRQWRAYLCFGKLRLSENSEWSRTATEKKPKRTSSSQSNNSSSALTFLSQNLEQTPGIGNPFEDGMITGDENPNVDVIFNELNSVPRNRQTTTLTRPHSYT